VETTVLRFELRGAPGTVTVRHGVNDDPRPWGYHLLAVDDVRRRLPRRHARRADDAGRRAAVRLLVGYDIVTGTPAPAPVAPGGPERWAAIRPALAAACRDWTFR
jgi:hypothetical protein